jgi:VWFA-related protein
MSFAMRSPLGFFLAFLLLLLAILPNLRVVPVSHAQSRSEKPTLKDFGSSLKKLKWDPVKQSTVESDDPKRRKDSPGDPDVIRVQTDLVVFDVQVRDRQGFVIPNLTRDDFIVTEDGGPQVIGHFSLGSDLTVPRSIVLIIDYSGSLRLYLNHSIDAAEVLIDKLGPKDKMAIVTDDVRLLAGFTGDAKKLKKALESLRRKAKDREYGRSFQMTALMATARELFDEEDIRPIVIFQTDGDEVGLLQPPDPRYYFMPLIPANTSETTKKSFESNARWMQKEIAAQIKPYSLNDVYKAVEKSRATVYTIIPGAQLVGIPVDQQYALVKAAIPHDYSDEQAKLITFLAVRAQSAAVGAASATGGWTAFLNKPEDAGDMYSTILSDINSRYVIGYYPTNKVHDGRRRTVSVTVSGHPDYVLSRRRSYYAPEPEQ